MTKTFKVTLKRGLIGTTQKQKDCARVLGLRKRESSAIVKDSPAIRGIIHKIQHLLDVEVEK